MAGHFSHLLLSWPSCLPAALFLFAEMGGIFQAICYHALQSGRTDETSTVDS